MVSKTSSLISNTSIIVSQVGTVPYKDMVVSHILTMNDCNLRVAAAGRFTYVVHVDLDEFLVPRQFADYSLVDVLRRWDKYVH